MVEPPLVQTHHFVDLNRLVDREWYWWLSKLTDEIQILQEQVKDLEARVAALEAA